jgi:PAS domain S-box-containing protein
MVIDLEKLRELTKDEESFNELVTLFKNHNNNSFFTFSEMRDFFFIERNREAPKRINVSKSVAGVLGYTAEEIEKKQGGFFSLIFDDDVSYVKRNINEFETNPKTMSMQQSFRVLDNQGKPKWLKEAISVERDEHGRVIRQLAVYCDINSSKENEQIFKVESDHLREINQAKDRFISIVSHDLRAPFTSLLGFSEILLNEKELSEEQKHEYLTYIHDASQNQLQLINYLLEWSRLQTGRIQMVIKRINLKVLVSTCVASLIGNAIRKDIELKQDIDGDIFVHADEKLISQAITNLLSNALKFTPKKSSVSVSSAKFKDGMIELIIKDQGRGISEKDQEKIFKIDQKFTLEGTDGEKGSGLGLTLVKEIVDKHKGDIWFYSKIDEGTEFHITLPEAKNIILLVEDDESLMEFYNKTIKKALPGYYVLRSKNGYEAMSIIMNSLPTIVITDHDMPLMNGYQLVEAIRKRDKDYLIPILVISAKMDPELQEKYERLGVIEILQKPIDQVNLVKTLTEISV